MATPAETFALAVQLHQAGNMERAEQLYREVCQADPQHGEARHMLGIVSYQQGRYEQAVEAIQGAVALNPENPDYRNNLALAFEACGNPQAAAASYAEALRLGPNMAEAHNNLGNLLQRQGQSQDAVEHYRHAVRLKPDWAKAHGGLGLALSALGIMDQAEAAYRRALTLHPSDAETHNNLGHLYYVAGRVPEAIGHCRQALLLNPQFVEALANLGNLYLLQADWSQAEDHFRNALRINPGFAEAIHGLGLAVKRQNRFAEAADCFQQALRINPNYAEAHYNLGNAFAYMNKVDDSIASFRRALECHRNFPNAWNNLGCTLASQEKYEEAAAALQEAVRQQPDYAEAHCNLGNALLRQGRAEETVTACQEAIRLKPDYAAAYCTLGAAHQTLGRLTDAAACFDHSLKLRPNYAEAHNGVGILLIEIGEVDQALPNLQHAVALKPDLAEAHSNLAGLLAENGQLEDAEKHFLESLRLKPSLTQEIVRVTRIPPIYQSIEDVHYWRRQLIDRVRDLQDKGVVVDLTNTAATYSFYPVYQGLNDRDLQRDLARFYRPPPDPIPTTPATSVEESGKIRIGFISRFFKEHTIARLMRGMIAQLSRERFHVIVFSIGHYDDAVTSFLKQHADEYVDLPPRFPAARLAIADKRLDVLFYTDIGMETGAYTLAFSRLAPVQCVTWGHPVTTGIPTMDYFISSELLEGDDAKQHYTEELVQLKNLAIYYYRPNARPFSKRRAEFELPESGSLYLCPQSTFKLHPAFDEILAGILRRDPSGIVGLLRGKHSNWERLLRHRFAAYCPDVANRIHFIAPQNHANFMSLNALAEVLLDTVHFGGGNTTYEGLALGVPIVTMPSPFLRGRITLALYKQMEMMDCVVSSTQEYIDLAVRLGTNREFRNEISAKILAKNDVLYENSAGVRELEEFLIEAVRKKR